MKYAPRKIVAVFASAILIGSCVGTEAPTGVGVEDVQLTIPINPALVPSPADGGALPINRIRARVSRVSDNTQLGSISVDVTPTAEEWTVTVDARVRAGGDTVSVYVHLIHVEGDVETIEFSGVVGPLGLTPGEIAEAADIPIVRGPVENVFVTGVSITSAPATLMEGRTATLAAEATTSGTTAPTLFWTVLDSAILAAADSAVTALVPGTGRVVASAGAFADTASIVVTPAPSSVSVSPDTISVVGVGAQATFQAAVLDVRGDTIAGETVVWGTQSGGVVTSLGDGLFEAAAIGTGIVTATSSSDASVVGTSVMVVGSSGGGPDIQVTVVANDSTPAVGDTVQVTVTVENLDVTDGADATALSVMKSAQIGFPVVGVDVDQGTFDIPSGVWTVGALDIGLSAQFTLDLEVPAGAAGQTLADSVWVTSVTPSQTNFANDTASVQLIVPQSGVDVAVLKTIDDPQPLADSTVVFTVSVVNNSTTTVTGLAVFDTLPNQFSAPQQSVSTGTLVNDSLWTIPTLAAGDTATWTTSTTVGPDVAGSSATNTAILRTIAQNDTVAANDTAVVAITFPFSAVPVVQITAPSDGAAFDPGVLVSFTGVATDPEDGDLSSVIQWTSDVDGALATGRTFETQALSTGVHMISAAATDADGGTGADTIQITIALITAPTTLNVPFGGTASLPITLSEPAQAGGLTLSVVATDPSVTTPTASTVFIPGGQTSANATLQGLQPGTTDVTVSEPQFGSAVTSVSVTAELNIIQSSLSVPETFPQPIDIRLQSQGSAIAAPPGGLTVTLTSLDPTCVSVPASVVIAEGLVQQTATVSASGSDQLPCSAYVRATAPSIDADSLNVTVTATPVLNVSPTTIGAGLQYGSLQIVLGTTFHGGATVRIESSDPSMMLVSPDVVTEATAFIDVPVPAGQNRAYYYVAGVEGQTGVAPLNVSATGFTSNSADVTVVQPGLDVSGLTAAVTTLTPDDLFSVRIGVPSGIGISPLQAVRVGGSPITATVVSSAPAVGDLITLPDSASPVTVTIDVGASSSPSNLASGGVLFEPLTVGTTDVSATIPGFVSTSNATRTVTVSEPGMTVNGTTVGAGLQYGNFQAVLGATDHGGVDVVIASSDPSVMLVSPNSTTAGSASITVNVPQGQNRANYYVHGMEGQGGTANLLVSAPGFTSNNTAVVNVVQPGVEIIGVTANTTTLSLDDLFQVRVGIPINGTFLSPVQAVRTGGTTLTATVETTDAAVAELLTLTDSVAPVTVSIAPGASTSANTVAGGGVAVTPLAAGSTQVSATIPGLIAVENATRDVTVTAPVFSVSSTTVGSGLQYGLFQVVLSATDHGGVTVRIASSDPSVMLVAPDAATAGSAFIDVAVADGGNRANYYVQGVEGQTGAPTLMVSAPGFTSNNSAVVNVVQPAYDVIGLNTTSLNTFSPDDLFQVRIGVPFNTSVISPQQSIRAGGTALTATISSSNVGVGQLKTLTDVSSPVTVSIVPGQAVSGNSVANGGVVFDPLGSGTTNVSASIPGLIAQSNASLDVTVTAPAITLNPQTVGSGLQYGLLRGILGSSTHGGGTVTLTSSNPSLFLVSPDADTPGSASIDVVVADGSNRVNYYLQGVEGASGTGTLTATASGFTDGTTTVTVVQAALDFVSLNSTYGAAAADDAFYARLGIPNAADTDVTIQQSIRAGGTAVTVTFTSSDPSVAQLVTSTASGGTIQLQILPGEARTATSVAAGGVAIDPLVAGSTFIEATAPGVTTTTDGTRTVTITP